VDDLHLCLALAVATGIRLGLRERSEPQLPQSPPILTGLPEKENGRSDSSYAAERVNERCDLAAATGQEVLRTRWSGVDDPALQQSRLNQLRKPRRKRPGRHRTQRLQELVEADGA
jgi:hypothetical protein